jgi:predicted NAD-dependent protein-ADP-ribosyltransferase YbiA (DUF1768 family)
MMANNHHHELTPFSSGSSAPRRWLSNLADAPLTLTWPMGGGGGEVDAVPVHMRGATATYDSAEHAYQALHSLDAQTAREFESGGRVSMDVFRAFPVVKGSSKAANPQFKVVDMHDKKEAHWGRQKGCRGIAAKMVANLPPAVAAAALGLNMMGRALAVRDTFAAQYALWRPIHVAKFTQNPHIDAVLRATAPTLLVEQGRFRQSAQYWSAFIDKTASSPGAPRLIGRNMMGLLLTAVRDDAH